MTVDEILTKQEAYFAYWGRPVEMDFSINGLNRELIVAMAAGDTGVYLGRYDGPELSPYTGQIVYNFAFDFCVPSDDDKLKDLLARKNKVSDPIFLLDEIMDRVEELGGHLLIWA